MAERRTWFAKDGTPLPPKVADRVDQAALAAMYEWRAAWNDLDLPDWDPPELNSATEYAYSIGYLNPRDPDYDGYAPRKAEAPCPQCGGIEGRHGYIIRRNGSIETAQRCPAPQPSAEWIEKSATWTEPECEKTVTPTGDLTVMDGKAHRIASYVQHRNDHGVYWVTWTARCGTTGKTAGEATGGLAPAFDSAASIWRRMWCPVCEKASDPQ